MEEVKPEVVDPRIPLGASLGDDLVSALEKILAQVVAKMIGGWVPAASVEIVIKEVVEFVLGMLVTKVQDVKVAALAKEASADE